MVFSLGFHMFCQIPCIVGYSENETGTPARLEWQAQKVNSAFNRYSSLMNGITIPIEDIYINPSVVPRKAGRPHNRLDQGTCQVQHPNRIEFVLGNWRNQMRITIFGKV